MGNDGARQTGPSTPAEAGAAARWRQMADEEGTGLASYQLTDLAMVERKKALYRRIADMLDALGLCQDR